MRFPLHFTRLQLTATLAALFGMVFYLAATLYLAPRMQPLYTADKQVAFAPTHFNDARQYVEICVQGYYVDYDPLPILKQSRMNWMPVYPVLICGLHQATGISFVYVSVFVCMLMVGLALYTGILTLRNLGVRAPALSGLLILTPIVGSAWLYLQGAEATYLAVGMVVMWLITLPPAGPRSDLLHAIAGLGLGIIFILTKPNALAFLLPLLFAFFYQSWRRSQTAGYGEGFIGFVADVVIEHLRPLLTRILPLFLHRPVHLESRPVGYDWTALAIAIGIVLGFTGWLAYTSLFSGMPFFFLQQQTTVWGRAWASGDLGNMVKYFRQAFNDNPYYAPWRLASTWNLAANLSALIPAASPRVPVLLRGMLPLMVLFLLYSGAVHGSDRYILSTALVALGWACWAAPQGGIPATQTKRLQGWLLRVGFVLLLSWLMSSLLVNQMFPIGQPDAYGVYDD